MEEPIEDNAILANIRGFHTVQEVSGGVKVCGNNQLEELAGLYTPDAHYACVVETLNEVLLRHFPKKNNTS